jgi:hypothetical protein
MEETRETVDVNSFSREKIGHTTRRTHRARSTDAASFSIDLEKTDNRTEKAKGIEEYRSKGPDVSFFPSHRGCLLNPPSIGHPSGDHGQGRRRRSPAMGLCVCSCSMSIALLLLLLLPADKNTTSCSILPGSSRVSPCLLARSTLCGCV